MKAKSKAGHSNGCKGMSSCKSKSGIKVPTFNGSKGKKPLKDTHLTKSKKRA